jgi:hypothetical protein
VTLFYDTWNNSLLSEPDRFGLGCKKKKSYVKRIPIIKSQQKPDFKNGSRNLIDISLKKACK